jgi:hypothetical protein
MILKTIFMVNEILKEFIWLANQNIELLMVCFFTLKVLFLVEGVTTVEWDFKLFVGVIETVEEALEEDEEEEEEDEEEQIDEVGDDSKDDDEGEEMGVCGRLWTWWCGACCRWWPWPWLEAILVEKTAPGGANLSK